MDSIPSYEFHRIFDRAAQTTNLKGKFTAEQIEEELIRVRDICERRSERAETRRIQTKYNFRAVQLERLVEYGFPQRVIAEARANPRGKVALTLTYGYEEAKRRLLAQARTRVRMTLVRRNRRSLP